MTKFYKKMPVLDALSVGARSYPGGLKKLAVRLKKSQGVLRSKLDRDVDTHVLSLEEAIQIIEHLDATVPSAADAIVRSLMWRLHRVAVRHDGVDTWPITYSHMTLLLIERVTDLCGTGGSMIDGAVPLSAADQLRKGISDCVEVLMQMDDYIDHHQASTRKESQIPRPQDVKPLIGCAVVQRSNEHQPDRRVLPEGVPLRVLTTPKNGK